jgi:hypothetical protein
MGRTPYGEGTVFVAQVAPVIRIKTIILVEDDPREVELTFATPGEDRLADKLEIVDNGTEALSFLYRRGRFEMRARGNPTMAPLDPDEAG